MTITENHRLTKPSDYVAERPQVFPSIDSWRWFVRQHRGELIAGGALVMPAGRQLVQVDNFDRALVDIGQRLAAQRSYSAGQR